jgi:hypothetical protein
MNAHQFTVILIRLFGLYCLYLAVEAMFAVTITYSSPNDSELLPNIYLALVFSVLVPLIVFFTLWFLPHTIARIISKTPYEKSSQPPSTNDWLRIIIIAIGLYWLIKSAMDAAYWASLMLFIRDSVEYALITEEKANMLATGVEMLTGLALLSKNRWLALQLAKLQ